MLFSLSSQAMRNENMTLKADLQNLQAQISEQVCIDSLKNPLVDINGHSFFLLMTLSQVLSKDTFQQR